MSRRAKPRGTARALRRRKALAEYDGGETFNAFWRRKYAVLPEVFGPYLLFKGNPVPQHA